MTRPFIRTTRSLSADRSNLSKLLVITFLVVGLLWCLWLTSAEIITYKTSTVAHLRQSGNLINLTAPVDGQVEKVNMSLGQAVAAGDLLVALKQDALLTDMQGTARLIDDVEEQLDALQAEESAQNESYMHARSSQETSIAQIRQRLESLQEVVTTLAQISARYKELLGRGQGSQVEYLDKEAARQQAQVTAMNAHEELQLAESELVRLDKEHALVNTSIDTRRALLRKELTALKNTAAAQAIESSDYTFTAPTNGVIASLEPLEIGDNVAAGSVLCTIRTEGSLSVEAYFPPAESLGHIKPGQLARVQLEGFAWTNYGRIPARVRSVASAIKDDAVRVELEIHGQVPSGLPMAHDIPALVEISTGASSPLALLLKRFAEWEKEAMRNGPPVNAGS